ncbi:hypothetical protein BGZ97_009611 [Linnemannia gamsii]|uniref:Uncharacterized protein n=1 Tax=Linnemannia gamsii TaxID=64522 RepID=A0A9P6UPH6_9FUNG|nr:hypothetical protein BGZ97_009611 [Linnemannia gamsii]
MVRNKLEQVRGLLLNAKLTSNLPEYLTRIRLYMNILLAEDPNGRPFLEATAKVVFLQGCPDDLQQLLRTDQLHKLRLAEQTPRNAMALNVISVSHFKNPHLLHLGDGDPPIDSSLRLE